jgi:hypothetical protein
MSPAKWCGAGDAARAEAPASASGSGTGASRAVQGGPPHETDWRQVKGWRTDSGWVL